LLATGPRRCLRSRGAVLSSAIGGLLAIPVRGTNPADSFNRIATADAGIRAAELFP